MATHLVQSPPKPPSQEVCCLIRIWAKAAVSREEPPGLGHLVAGTSADVGEEEVLNPGFLPVGWVGVGPLGTWIGGALEQAPPWAALQGALLLHAPHDCTRDLADPHELLAPPQAPSQAPVCLRQALPHPLQPLFLVPIPFALWMSDIVACFLDSKIPFRPDSPTSDQAPPPRPHPTTPLVSFPSYPFVVGLPGELALHPRAISVTPGPQSVSNPLHLPSPDLASILARRPDQKGSSVSLVSALLSSLQSIPVI